MRFFLFISLFFIASVSFSQGIPANLQQVVKKFENDSQMRHAVYSLYVIDASSGKPVFEKNSQVGLATASCLKLVTSAMSFEKLGSDFKYETKIRYTGTIKDDVLTGNVFITGSGDPTLGSWRWETTKMDKILDQVISIFKQKNISKINGRIFIDDMGMSRHDVVPGDWAWNDIGNYYGAPARTFNWNENQYDIFFKSDNERGSYTVVKKTTPELPGINWSNYVTAGAKGSGDQTLIYLPPFSTTGYITGTIPAGEDNFSVSGAMPDPTAVFVNDLRKKIKESGIVFNDSIIGMLNFWNQENRAAVHTDQLKLNLLGAIASPSFDKMNFWFMRRSINLYGETFLRTQVTGDYTGIITYKKAREAAKAFWKERGIEESALNIYDGSGLAPANRVTTAALVKVLQYAKTRPWFASYYEAFPVYNDMKLKSGTIGDVKGFAGYHKARNGKEYIIAFLVNNFDGSASSIVGKMYKVLDEFK